MRFKVLKDVNNFGSVTVSSVPFTIWDLKGLYRTFINGEP